MTSEQKRAAWTFAALWAAAGVGAWMLGELRIPNPWVTLKNKQRVELDDDGRIRHGLPRRFRGIALRDLTRVSREVSKTKRRQRREQAKLFPRSRSTFKNKDQAVRELFAANPQLRTFRDAHFGRDDERFLKWRANGRRGPKPTTSYADGRLDGINYTWDLHGPRAANTWTEAIYETVPSSGRWADFAERLPVLEEATGLSLELPAPAARVTTARADREQYEEGAELELEDVYERARASATMHTSGDDDVPF